MKTLIFIVGISLWATLYVCAAVFIKVRNILDEA